MQRGFAEQLKRLQFDTCQMGILALAVVGFMAIVTNKQLLLPFLLVQVNSSNATALPTAASDVQRLVERLPF
jgi:hypothetical protein